MGVETIEDITLERKKAISFLLDNTGLSSHIISLYLDYIDALDNERDLLIKQQENEFLR